MESSIQAFLASISIPEVGLMAVGLMAFAAATILPFSSEISFFTYLIHYPENLWLLILVASIGNTVGGVVSWQIGFWAKEAKNTLSESKISKIGSISAYLHKFGAKSLLFSWVPIIGDPLVMFAGWSKLPFIPCCIYMAIGKTLRYIVIVFFYISAN